MGQEVVKEVKSHIDIAGEINVKPGNNGLTISLGPKVTEWVKRNVLRILGSGSLLYLVLDSAASNPATPTDLDSLLTQKIAAIEKKQEESEKARDKRLELLEGVVLDLKEGLGEIKKILTEKP